MTGAWVRPVFAVAGVYDLVIGLAFLAFGPQIFEAAGVPPPNHWGYIQFAAFLVAIFGGMFLAVAANPPANRNLIPYGILLKFSYVAVAGSHWLNTDIPFLFKPFVVIDAVMLVLFVVAYISVRAVGRPSGDPLTPHSGP